MKNDLKIITDGKTSAIIEKLESIGITKKQMTKIAMVLQKLTVMDRKNSTILKK